MKGPGGKGIAALEALLEVARQEADEQRIRADAAELRADALAVRVREMRAELDALAKVTRAVRQYQAGSAEDTLHLAAELERRGTHELLIEEKAALAVEVAHLQAQLASMGEEVAALAGVHAERDAQRAENTRLREDAEDAGKQRAALSALNDATIAELKAENTRLEKLIAGDTAPGGPDGGNQERSKWCQRSLLCTMARDHEGECFNRHQVKP